MASKRISPTREADIRKAPFYRFGEGFWQFDDKKKCPETGKYVRITGRWFSTINEARTAYESKYEEVMRLEIQRANAEKYVSTWEELKELYIKERSEIVRSSSLYSKDFPILKAFFDPYYHGKTIAQIFTKQEAIDFKERVTHSLNKNGVNYSKKDQNRAINTYRMILDLAYERDLIGQGSYIDCSVKVKPVKKREEKPQSMKKDYYTDEEIKALLEAVPDDTLDGLLVRFLLWTGFRVGEALGLTAGQVDLERKVIRKEYIWGVGDNGKFQHLKRTKNNSDGDYYISDQVADLLRGIIEQSELKPDQFVFPSPQWAEGGSDYFKRPMDRSAFARRVNKICKENGIPEFHPHMLRHTFCTRLSRVTTNSNEDRKAIESLTGHSFNVDQETYNHANEKRARELLRQLPKF